MSFIDRMQKIFEFGKYSRWKKGELIFLIKRGEFKREFELIYPGKMPMVELALKEFCDAMDIKHSQLYQLRPSDIIFNIYKKVRVSEYHDDMEIERLYTSLKDRGKTGFEKWFTSEKTIQDWIDVWT